MKDETSIRDAYFSWLYKGVCGNDLSYRTLLYFLHVVPFTYSNELDENRVYDGISLRKRFADATGITENDILRTFSPDYCSFLEMMISLAYRCEIDIMADENNGDQTSWLFWVMVRNMGLHNMTNERFDIQKAQTAVSKVMDRDHAPNGDGGCMFRIEDPTKDMRKADIWYQAMWWLAENL